jgi:outer membrane lipoprotein SlyB
MIMNARSNKLALTIAMAASLALAGCVTAPYGGNYDRGYGYQGQPYHQRHRCDSCGVVQDVQQVYIRGGNGNGGALGAVIGAVAGGVLGSTIGKGNGRTAATVAGAVGGGVVGNQIGRRNDGDDIAWRIVVQLDNGQYATVTQRQEPGVRNGDYVVVRDGQVYVLR